MVVQLSGNAANQAEETLYSRFKRTSVQVFGGVGTRQHNHPRDLDVCSKTATFTGSVAISVNTIKS